MLVHSTSLTTHETIVNTRDTAAGDFLDKVARALQVPWGDKMPGAALETWSDINDADADTCLADIERWGLPRPLTNDKEHVLAYSFTGLRTAVEKCVRDGGDGMGVEDKKSLGRAAQILMFEHVMNKTTRAISHFDELDEGKLVISGGVASNQSFREAYYQRPPLKLRSV